MKPRYNKKEKGFIDWVRITGITIGDKVKILSTDDPTGILEHNGLTICEAIQPGMVGYVYRLSTSRQGGALSIYIPELADDSTYLIPYHCVIKLDE